MPHCIQSSSELSSTGYILPSSTQPQCSYTTTSTLPSSLCPYPSVSPSMQSHSAPQPFPCHDYLSCTPSNSPSYPLPHCYSYQGNPQAMSPFMASPCLPSGSVLAPPPEQQQSLPPVQLFQLSQQPLESVEGAIPGSIPSSRPCETVRTMNRKKCIVAGCQELLAPTMWRSHMTLHARGLFSGAVPNVWLEVQDLHCCASCHQLVANSRSSSHTQCCKGRALPTPNPMWLLLPQYHIAKISLI